MQFISTHSVQNTRHTSEGYNGVSGLSDNPLNFHDAIFQNLAEDGKLLHPAQVPNLSELIRSFGTDAAFSHVAAQMLHALLPAEYDEAAAQNLVQRAVSFSPTVSELRNDVYLLELFHGPSCAFKDFGASFLAAFMDDELARHNQHSVVLTATSGDTGSAVAQAFLGREHIDVVVLYPSGRVSPLQEQQLTTLGRNIHALELQGSFDDCQRIVKELFMNREFSQRLKLSSANSINIGRLLPQSFYYVYGSMQFSHSNELMFLVPSGNFGNLTAGVLAWQWGMPVSSFVAVTNANDVVPQYLQTHKYMPRASVQTLANAMDVGAPSNFERLQAIFYGKDMNSMLSGYSVSDAEILSTMKAVYNEQGIFVCPHTATAVHIAYQLRNKGNTAPMLCLATAHPAKFIEVCRQATGAEPAIPERLARALTLPKQSSVVENTTAAVRLAIEKLF